MESKLPRWLLALNEEELNFIKNFILMSGSLKEIAKYYEVTYPTVRIRLNRLIQKINMNNEINSDQFINLIKNLAIDEQINYNAAKILISEYKNGRDNK